MDGIEMDVDYEKERVKEKDEYEDEKKLLLTTMTTIGFDADGSYKLDEYALSTPLEFFPESLIFIRDYVSYQTTVFL